MSVVVKPNEINTMMQFSLVAPELWFLMVAHWPGHYWAKVWKPGAKQTKTKNKKEPLLLLWLLGVCFKLNVYYYDFVYNCSYSVRCMCPVFGLGLCNCSPFGQCFRFWRCTSNRPFSYVQGFPPRDALCPCGGSGIQCDPASRASHIVSGVPLNVRSSN